jgi:hypothetical protein
MQALQIQQDPNQNFMLMQRQWAAILNALLRAPLSSATILEKVSLVVGANTIPTLINRPLIGWAIIRQRGAASIYDTQDNNPTPTQNLLLVSSAAVVIDLVVF